MTEGYPAGYRAVSELSPPPASMTRRPDGLPVELSAPATAQVDRTARTISGLVVPYGPAGQTAAGSLTFASGSLRWSDPKRVKLLLEHDQRSPVGYATALEDRPEGLWAEFHLPEGEAGTRALQEAQDGLRDGLSVGSQLDDAVAHRLRRAQANGGAVAATGQLREVSLVSVPAFDDARVATVAASAGLVVSSWTDQPLPTDPEPEPQPAQPNPAAGEDQPMTTTTEDAPVDVQADGQEPEARPVVRAAAGAALVTAEAPTYTFGAGSPYSLLADAAAAQNGDGEAAGRLARFNAELASGNQPTQQALSTALQAQGLATAAVLTRSPVPDAFLPTAQRPVLDTTVQAQRVISPLAMQVRITNAQPFQVPTVGKFVGVGDHVEGTPHVAEGTLTLGQSVVIPQALSGAYRVARELIDQSNPVLDQIALRKMVDDYARAGEARNVAALAAAVPTATAGVGTVMDLRAALLAVPGPIRPAAVIVGRDYLATLSADADADGRPFFSTAQAVNSPAVMGAGFTNMSIDGTPIVVSEEIPAAEAYILKKDALLFAESSAQTFRLEQPEGPGIVKLAVWGYAAAQVLDATGIRRITA